MCLVIVFLPPSVVLNPQSDPDYIEALVQQLHQTLTITPEHMPARIPNSNPLLKWVLL